MGSCFSSTSVEKQHTKNQSSNPNHNQNNTKHTPNTSSPVVNNNVYPAQRRADKTATRPQRRAYALSYVPTSLRRQGSQHLKLDDCNDKLLYPDTTTTTTTSNNPNVKSVTYNHIHEAVTYGIIDRSVPEEEQQTISSNNDYPNGVVGIQNLGNTCFFNSSIQCLSNTIPLTDYVLGYDYRKEINIHNPLGTQGKLITSYTELMKKIWLGTNQKLSPNPLLPHIHSFASSTFQPGYQHDAQELLSYLLDGMHEDLNRVVTKPYVEDLEGDGTNDDGDSMISWERYLMRNRSIIVDIFQGQLKNTLQCTKCKYKSVKFDPFMYLSLPMNKSTATVDDCLRLFCKEESLTGDNQWYCRKCQCHVDAVKKFDLWTLPPILIVHLKRFECDPRNGHLRKLNQKVAFSPRDWNVSEFVARVNNPNNNGGGGYPTHNFYDLYAMSNHYGEFGSGHYTSFAMNRLDNSWYHFNDSKVTPLTYKDVRNNEAAYVLFYNRTDRTDLVDSSTDRNVVNSDRTPVILRQTVSRPEHWPHLQTGSTLRNYMRPSVRDLHS